MKRIKAKDLTKQIICIMTVLMLCNFIIPHITFATSDEDSGTIFAPFFKFITFLCDNVMQFMQDTFITMESIKKEDGTYDFQYSPGIIFSGTVPAFDVDFITPGESKIGDKTEFGYTSVIDAITTNRASKVTEVQYATGLADLNSQSKKNIAIEDIKTSYEYSDTNQIDIESLEGELRSNKSENQAGDLGTTKVINEENTMECAWYNEDKSKIYVIVDYFKIEQYIDSTGTMSNTNLGVIYLYQINSINDLENAVKVVGTQSEKVVSSKEYTSTASILQTTVATWYNALRRIALVGLLSVLVYVGIQIVITSASGKENSRYKKMLVDWLIALCLLFTLHYIMNATLIITKEISSLFNNGETDNLLNSLRTNIETGEIWEEVASQVIMYIIMVIYTVMFSFQYLKRVLYMAFFTIIAPLITLTYPLDKMKDSKAQAFTMWIREYIFNAFIQVIHLVVYYTLVGSAISLVDTYPLYGILAIGFITQAERIIRKMFGFNNATTIGTIQAAAMGGLITGALNKLQKVSRPNEKTEKSSDSSSNNVRTISNSATSNAISSLKGQGQVPGTSSNANKGENSKSSANVLLGGAMSVIGKNYKKVGGAVLGTGLGATGAMIGLASGVAQGDVSTALTGAVMGAKAGKGAGQRLTNGINLGNIKNSINDLKDTYNEGAYGAEYAQSAKEIREFKTSSEYKALKDTYGDSFTDDKLNAMLQAGIKDKSDMDKVLRSENTNDAIGYYTLAKKCPDDIYYDDEKLQMYLEDLGVSQTNATKMRENMRAFR